MLASSNKSVTHAKTYMNIIIIKTILFQIDNRDPVHVIVDTRENKHNDISHVARRNKEEAALTVMNPCRIVR